MLEGLLTPPNVRTHKDYSEKFHADEVEDWINDDVEVFENLVLMGVPETELDQMIETADEVLGMEAFKDAEVHAHEEEGELLDAEYNEIDYDRSPSRIADIEWMRREMPSDEDVAVLSFDYNIRTGHELDRRMDDHSSFGQFALDFSDFMDFTTASYMLGLLPFNNSFGNESESEKSFEYELPELGESNIVVLNVPYSDDISDYEEKLKTEALRYGLARLPYGQRMKDYGKRAIEKVFGEFEY